MKTKRFSKAKVNYRKRERKVMAKDARLSSKEIVREETKELKMENLLINKTIVALRGFKVSKKKKANSLDYILFDDGETYLQFEDQDCYTFHDCSRLARTITLRKNADTWKIIKMNDEYYGDVEIELGTLFL